MGGPAGARRKEGLTQKELAGLIGISQNHVSAMEHGKRPIGKEIAKRLARELQVDYWGVFIRSSIGNWSFHYWIGNFPITGQDTEKPKGGIN